ncbi:MAG TPA: LPS assembly protein LptD [Patescibacteria group bacterium]|nr:LPS assembly protein LptD [Patescibacteria group bacterium]
MKGRPKHLQILASIFALTLAAASAATAAGTQGQARTGAKALEIQADRQRKAGSLYYASGDVVARYQAMTLRADQVEYDASTRRITASGHVRFDYRNQTVEASSGWYDLASGRGSFQDIRGTIRTLRPPSPTLLVSPNPLTFRARRIERTGAETYVVYHAWLTVCDPRKPKWKFYTRRAVIHVDRSVKLYGADFRMFSIPLVYLPYATLPAGRNLRRSGFLIPSIGESSLKGFVLGDSYYWAPARWLDMTLGGQYFSRRGWSQSGNLRATPSRNVHFEADYFGVKDRGIPVPGGGTIKQGGFQAHEQFDALFGNNWRLAADLNQLSSMTFRLGFAETYAQAVDPEVISSGFVSNNFDGYSLDFAALNYKNFLSLSPEQAVVIRQAPEARFSSIDRPLFGRLPLYFGFDIFADAMHRSETEQPHSDTGQAVQRTEVAPSLTLPLRWGPWLGITPTFVLRATRYGAQQGPGGTVVNRALDRTTEEVTVDIRPPVLAREWGSGSSRWKHTIEPQIVYRYVNGVNDFGAFIRFGQDETLTDTNEVEYSVTQRLFHRRGKQGGSELVSWQLAQKYYFDPTFGGALVPGQRNVFQATDSLTPFAFADRARNFSPLISDLRIEPGGRWDVQLREDFDPLRGKLTAAGTLVTVRPWRASFLTLSDFNIESSPVLEPVSNQIRALAGYGNLTRPGWNASFGIGYDAQQHLFQNQIAQISYNGSCCGIAFEYRRLALGPLRTENQFRIALMIANIGTFGDIRRKMKIF